MQDRERVVGVGILGLFGFVVLARFAPGIASAVLMAFSVLVFILAAIGLLQPSLVRLPNRAAAVWAWALSVGLFFGGAMIQGPSIEDTAASDTRERSRRGRATVTVPTDPIEVARGRIRGLSNCLRDAAASFTNVDFESCRRRTIVDNEWMLELRAAGLAIAVEGIMAAATPVVDEARQRSADTYTDMLHRLSDELRAVSLGEDAPGTDWRELRRQVRSEPTRTEEAAAAGQPGGAAPPSVARQLAGRLDDVWARTNCNIRFQEQARAIFGQQGLLYRWTETDQDARFPDKRPTSNPNIVTYTGNALEVQVDGGAWLEAVYGCDWNTATEEIVGIRAVPGRIQ